VKICAISASSSRGIPPTGLSGHRGNRRSSADGLARERG
jgi:hypothetical protein